jgi:hypothetical protein
MNNEKIKREYNISIKNINGLKFPIPKEYYPYIKRNKGIALITKKDKVLCILKDITGKEFKKIFGKKALSKNFLANNFPPLCLPSVFFFNIFKMKTYKNNFYYYTEFPERFRNYLRKRTKNDRIKIKLEGITNDGIFSLTFLNHENKKINLREEVVVNSLLFL